MSSADCVHNPNSGMPDPNTQLCCRQCPSQDGIGISFDEKNILFFIKENLFDTDCILLVSSAWYQAIYWWKKEKKISKTTFQKIEAL